MELSGFYGGGGGGGGGDTDTSSLSNGEGGGLKAGGSSPYPAACGRPSLPALKFHNHFPPDNLSSLHDKKDSLLMQVQELQGSVLQGVQQPGLTGAVSSNRLHLQQQPHLRSADAEERVMLYVRQESEEFFTPLHVTPPTVQGLLNAVRNNALKALFFYTVTIHIDISHTRNIRARRERFQRALQLQEYDSLDLLASASFSEIYLFLRGVAEELAHRCPFSLLRELLTPAI